MAISNSTIEKLEELAMLKLDDSEKESLKEDLDKLIQMFDKLSELDTSGVTPLKNINNHKQELREDKVVHSISKAEALGNAKKATADYFVVPKVIKK